MDSELLRLLVKFSLSDSFKQFLIDHGYTTKASWLKIPTEQNALRNYFAECKEFSSNLQLRRTFQSMLFELNPEAAEQEYVSFSSIIKQSGGSMGASNQTSGSAITPFSGSTAQNAPTRVTVEDRKPALIHTPSSRNTQSSHTQHVAEVKAVRTDGKSSRDPHQNNPYQLPSLQRLSIEPTPAQSSSGPRTVVQRSTGGNVSQVSRPTATTYNSSKKEISQADSKQTIHNNSARIASLPTERIAILGRQTVVGTEYDACTNTYFDSKDNLTFDTKKFADNENLPEVQIFPFPQSVCDRLDLIGLNSNQKADFLVGLLENQLATSLANEPNGENDEEKVIVRYRFKSHLHSRNMTAGNYQSQNKKATHIVVGVEYGTEVVFVLSEKPIAEQITLTAFLTEVIGRIKLMKEGGSMGMEGRFTKIRCQAFSNGDDYQAKSFYHAALILHSLMTESAGQQHIPQTAIIQPLRQKLFSLSQGILNEIERFRAMNMSTSRCLTQLKASDPELSKIVGIDNLNAALKSMCQQVLAVLKEKLICIRHGSEDEKSIAQFLRENYTENNRQAKMVEHTTDAIKLFSKMILSPLRGKGISEIGVEPKIVLEVGIAPPNQVLAESYLSMGGEECLKKLFPWMQSFNIKQELEEVSCFVKLLEANKGKEKHFCYRIKTNVSSTDRLFTCFLEERGNRFIVPNIISGAFIDISPQKIAATSIVLRVETCWVWKQSNNTAIKIIPCEAQICAVRADKKGTSIQTKKVTIPSDVIIDGLTESTSYAITFEATFSYGFTFGKRQQPNNIRTMTSPVHMMISKSKPVENEPGFYALPKREVARGTGFRRFQVGSHKINQIGEKVILVVGGTGSGKSTFINAMVNFLYEVGFLQQCRLQLITKQDELNESKSNSSAQSQTKIVSAYELNETRLPYRITIVDTPGFGDTEGISRDKLTIDYIKEWFERRDAKGLQTIDAVCTVIKSNEDRLTARMQYELGLVQGLFEKDVAKNMITAFTFCDNREPIAIQALKDVLVGETKLNFNNYFFTALPSNDSVMELHWKQTNKSFENLFKIIETFEPRSIIHTLEVLNHRKSLEEQAAKFSEQVPMQVKKIKEIEHVINQLEYGDYVLKQAQNFNIKRKRFIQVKVPVKHGVYTTFCKQCTYTCHEDCKEVKGNDNLKYKCNVMTVKNDKYARCTICPNKCLWTAHVNASVIAKQVEWEEEVTVGQVLEEYQIKLGAKQGAETLLELLAIDLMKQDKILVDTIKAIRQNLNFLSEISLRDGNATDSEYLHFLIEEEKQRMQQGSEDRIAVLYTHLKIVKLLESEQQPGGLLTGETESTAIAYLGKKYPKLYKKLALKGYFNTNFIHAENKSILDEATLERIERNYPAEFHSIRKNPNAKLSETSSKAMVGEFFRRIYPSFIAAVQQALKEEAGVNLVSGEETPSEYTVDADLAELNRRIDQTSLNDSAVNDNKSKPANSKMNPWKRLKTIFR